MTDNSLIKSKEERENTILSTFVSKTKRKFYMEIAIIIALILLNGVFAMSEIALISA